MAAPQADWGATLSYGSGPTAVANLLTCRINKGSVPKSRSDIQSDTSKKYRSGKPDCGSLDFTAQLAKAGLDALESQYNVSQTWTYTDPDGGVWTCTAGVLGELEQQTQNSDDTATYSGHVEFYILPTYSAA